MVPSLDVASNCSTVCREASNLGGSFLTTASVSVAQVGEPQARRRQETGDAHECPFAVNVRVGNVKGGVVGEHKLAARPFATSLRRVDVRAAFDVVEHGDQQMALGGSRLRKRLARPRRIDQCRLEMVRMLPSPPRDQWPRESPEGRSSRRRPSSPREADNQSPFDKRLDVCLRRQRQLRYALRITRRYSASKNETARAMITARWPAPSFNTTGLTPTSSVVPRNTSLPPTAADHG